MVAAARARRQLRKRFDTSPATYRALKSFGTWLMHLLYRYEITGMENVPEAGATILAINHLHLLDAFAVMPIVSRQIITLAASKWYNNLIVGSLLRLAGVIFVRRGEVDREALRQCLDVLQGGGLLAIAPEGTRSHTGGLQAAKAGIGYLAARSDAMVVPVAIWGVEHLREWMHLRKPTCYVTIGRPFRPERPAGKLSSQDLQQMADQVMVRIAELLPPEYRGVYAGRVAAGGSASA